jgi:hypothetical protein
MTHPYLTKCLFSLPGDQSSPAEAWTATRLVGADFCLPSLAWIKAKALRMSGKANITPIVNASPANKLPNITATNGLTYEYVTTIEIGATRSSHV